MEIPEIKSKLTLATVLHYYGLKPDKQLRLRCPFHDDKTPSLQVYYKTHTAYCFSSNCKTHGKSLDVIDFVMNMEKCGKHEAIKKAIEILGGEPKKSTKPNSQQNTDLQRVEFLERMFTYFKNAIHNSKPAQEYLKQRCLWNDRPPSFVEVGYNSGQFHHGARKDENLINECLKYGLLLDLGLKARTGDTAYKPFGKWGVCFPLKNKENQIVSLYFRSTLDDKAQRHFYLKDRQGLYPSYPKPSTRKLILTESIIDAATLLEQSEIRDKYEMLALFGTNGFTDEHTEAIRNLKELEEVIFFLNGDEPGIKAVEKYAPMLKAEYPNLIISNIAVPEGEDVNSLLQVHSPEILAHLIETRKEYALLFSTEEKPIEKESIPEQQSQKPNALNADNPNNIHYQSKEADYYVKGGLRGYLDSLKASLQLVHKQSRLDYRAKLDLYEYKQVEAVSKAASDHLGMEQTEIKKDLSLLTHLLENYRNQSISERKNKHQRTEVKIPQATVNQCLDVLQSENPIEAINKLIGQAGVVGEDDNRLFLFALASSYKMPDTLHALIQGSSGSGKTRLLKTIFELMPPEDTIKFTRVTDSSFYNYPEDYLVNKLLGFEDIDGLKEDALYAVRELISNEILVSSTTTKTEQGQIMAMEKTVRGPIASVSCTTKGEIYEDNMSRVFLIAVDESHQQTQRIINYQQQKAAGLIDSAEERKAKELLQNCIRLLTPYEVINPYANKIQLPPQAHKIRRLNDLYLSFVKQVTLLNQYKRNKDKKGRLITEKEDLHTANEIMFDSIILKVDELDGSLRLFYEKLKDYVLKEGKDYDFSQREIRQHMNISKTGCQNYINSLLELEYIHKSYSAQRNTQHYKIAFWDNLQALREKTKSYLDEQLRACVEPDQSIVSDQNNMVGQMVGQVTV